jgi:hypothetical protein
VVVGETDDMAKRWAQSRGAVDPGSGSSTLNLLHYVVVYSDLTDKFKDRYDFEYRFLPLPIKANLQGEEALLISGYAVWP